MRKLTLVLGFIVLCTGCPRRTEGVADASALAPAETRQALPDAGDAERGAETEGESAKGPGESAPPGHDGAEGDAGAPPPRTGLTGAPAGGEEACVDRWLEARGLDRYGHPEGTMYAGGTPLFDEATGQRVDRLVYVYGRHPEARASCAPGKPAPPPRGPARQ